MGGALVKQAFDSEAYRQVGHTSRLVLLRMALVAHDSPTQGNPGRWFFESRFTTASALGYTPPRPGDEAGSTADADRDRSSADLAVRRAVRALVTAGAIVRRSEVDPGHIVQTGRAEEYFVLVGLTPAERAAYLDQWRPDPVDNRGGRGTSKAPQAGHGVHPRSGMRGAIGVHPGVHEEYPQGAM